MRPATDDELAAAFARLRADPDDSIAQVMFGRHVLYSHDPPNDISLVMDLFRLGASYGDPKALQYYANLLIQTGHAPAGFEFLKIAADIGDGHDKFSYAGQQIRCHVGDPIESADYFRRGADAGSIDACWAYGVMLLDGSGVAQDSEMAVRYFERAVNAGNP
jgi:TPR repeat protein